jgi:hypothetical protein
MTVASPRGTWTMMGWKGGDSMGGRLREISKVALVVRHRYAIFRPATPVFVLSDPPSDPP